MGIKRPPLIVKNPFTRLTDEDDEDEDEIFCPFSNKILHIGVQSLCNASWPSCSRISQRLHEFLLLLLY